MALPLPLRNRLAELILKSLYDPEARSALGALVDFCADPGRSSAPASSEFAVALRAEYRRFRDECCERAVRAWRVLRQRPLGKPGPDVGEVLGQAADLFDAHLFFEVHELLEPYWVRAAGATREALQGLIQIAVGFQHLANANVEGARMLLEEGRAKVADKHLEGLDLVAFGGAVGRSLAAVVALGQGAARAFDWARVPPFPRRG